MNTPGRGQLIDDKDTGPFFSIVLPTKNRSFLVGYAIKSVLMQSFENFELIIVDNDDTEATGTVVTSFRDPRIGYYRTGNLSMPDNWEYGCTKAVGKYLLIIEDKMALKPDALLKIFRIIQQDRPEVITWQHDFFDEDTGTGNPNLIIKFKKQFVPSDQIVKSFLNCDMDFFINHSPRGYNSCIDMTVIKKIQNELTKRLCMPASPDYTLAFQILNVVQEVLSIPDTLVTMGGIKYSQGMSFFRKGEFGELFIKELNIREFDLYANVPIKVRCTHNTLLNDYINISNIIGGRLKKYQLNKFNYYLYIYNELQRAKNEKIDVEKELNGWNESLSSQADDFIRTIQNELRRTGNKQEQSLFGKVFHRIGAIGIFNFTEGALHAISWKMGSKKKYCSILEYAGF
jgi:glycosyltransferase involved in cell wall biosynthesis